MTLLCSRTLEGRTLPPSVFAKCDWMCWLTRKKLHPGFDVLNVLRAWRGLIGSCLDAAFSRPRSRMRAIRMEIERVRHAESQRHGPYCACDTSR